VKISGAIVGTSAGALEIPATLAPVPMPAQLALLDRHEAAASEFELTRADGERTITRGRVDLV
jgi:hypothetical protein